MNGLGWIVGGSLAYVGLAIGAALFVALAVAVVRGQRRMRALEERLARAEQVQHDAPQRSAETALALRPVANEDDDTLVPTPLRSDEEPEPLTEEHEAAEGEDVLEETPEFLQETPEHDRLWFEQKPPRDFDF